MFCGAEVTDAMGVSGKWIRALVGLKKPEKSQSSEKNENVGIISINLKKKKKTFYFSSFVKSFYILII